MCVDSVFVDSVEWRRLARRARDRALGEAIAAGLGRLRRWVFHLSKRVVTRPNRACYDC